MSNSVGSHRQQPTRLPRPWDSPGKNTGLGCHFLLQRMKVRSEREVAQSCQTLHDPMNCSPPGSSVHGTLQARVLERGAIAFSDEWVYLFVKMWLMKTVQSLGYYTVRVQLSRGSNSKDITQSINQQEGAIQTLPCQTISGRWLDRFS